MVSIIPGGVERKGRMRVVWAHVVSYRDDGTVSGGGGTVVSCPINNTMEISFEITIDFNLPHLVKCLFPSKCFDLPGTFVLVLPIGAIFVCDLRVDVGVELEVFVRAVNKF